MREVASEAHDYGLHAVDCQVFVEPKQEIITGFQPPPT
jgi:hypothetical protein